MTQKTSTIRSAGVGVPGLLGILFVGLKLGGIIDWSWLWVLAPFWIGPAVVLFGILSMFVVMFIKESRK